ncbi:MAG: bifunctional sulfate adenylyltransferase/adenylylsulfate kinase [Desulfobacteraceae bacterium]|nr:bifunctional sulfate adenylyltransferase/adenylylsulfate kinase [Desulfobacteraceae bacterium]
MTDIKNLPHGGRLIDLCVDEDRTSLLKKITKDLPDITMNDRQMCDLELIANGSFSPLAGFMTQKDYEPVLDRMMLENQLVWPLPVCLDINETTARNLEAGQSIALRDPEGFLLAVMHVEDIWPIDKNREAEKIYASTDASHFGVDFLFHSTGDYYVGGPVEVISLPMHSDFKQLRMTPSEARNLYKKLGWQRVVGFQSQKIIHRPEFEITISAMREARANLLLMPVVGMTHPDNFDHYTRVNCYREAGRNYPPETHVLNLLSHSPRNAGLREALLHAVISKNYGCSHHILEQVDDLPNGNKKSTKPIAHKKLLEFSENYGEQIGISVMAYDKMVYLPFEDEYRQKHKIPRGSKTIVFTGQDIRDRIRTGRKMPEWASFPEIINCIQKAYPPPSKQGFTLFLTGLSGAGKSTIARVLYSKMMEIGNRPVSLLDGDIVRHHLSSELTFSKEHRDINVRRIGFVAQEITKNRGIAICAPIAPYARTRREIRDMIAVHGGFIVVHVSTPIEECERRDRKGMYAKARAGLIKGYTGVDDPYEIPEFPEIRIDTSDITPDEAAQQVLLYLGQKGFI